MRSNSSRISASGIEGTEPRTVGCGFGTAWGKGSIWITGRIIARANLIKVHGVHAHLFLCQLDKGVLNLFVTFLRCR